MCYRTCIRALFNCKLHSCKQETFLRYLIFFIILSLSFENWFYLWIMNNCLKPPFSCLIQSIPSFNQSISFLPVDLLSFIVFHVYYCTLLLVLKMGIGELCRTSLITPQTVAPKCSSLAYKALSCAWCMPVRGVAAQPCGLGGTLMGTVPFHLRI